MADSISMPTKSSVSHTPLSQTACACAWVIPTVSCNTLKKSCLSAGQFASMPAAALAAMSPAKSKGKACRFPIVELQYHKCEKRFDSRTCTCCYLHKIQMKTKLWPCSFANVLCVGGCFAAVQCSIRCLYCIVYNLPFVLRCKYVSVFVRRFTTQVFCKCFANVLPIKCRFTHIYCFAMFHNVSWV